VYFGVLSISQPVVRASPRESPGFVGFYGVFLDFRKSGFAATVYLLNREVYIPLEVVVSSR
jgi:hypothetical protein